MKALTDKIVLGTAQFGMPYGINNKIQLSKNEVFAILDYAYEAGIRILDTAEIYGNAHQIIAEYHKISSEKFEIITKFSPDNKNSFLDSININLELFGIEHFYSYLFHKFTNFKELNNNDPEALKLISNTNKIKKIGVSVYKNEEVVEALNYRDISLIQLPFNLLDNSNLRKDIFHLMQARNIEVHTRSVFLQGLFFKEINEFSGNLVELKKYILKINDILKKNKISMAELSLNYALHNPQINKILIGVDNLNQLKLNVKNISETIDNTIFEEIEEIFVEQKELLNPSNWIV